MRPVAIGLTGKDRSSRNAFKGVARPQIRKLRAQLEREQSFLLTIDRSRNTRGKNTNVTQQQNQ